MVTFRGYWHSHPECLHCLQNRVQCGQVLYVGSSAGSISAGQELKYCEDEPRPPNAANISGLGIVDINVGVYHAKRNPFEITDKKSVVLGPRTCILVNGLDGGVTQSGIHM